MHREAVLTTARKVTRPGSRRSRRRHVLEAHLDRIEAVNDAGQRRSSSVRRSRHGARRAADAADREHEAARRACRSTAFAAVDQGLTTTSPACSTPKAMLDCAAERRSPETSLRRRSGCSTGRRVRRRQVQPARLPDALEHRQRPLRRSTRNPRDTTPGGRRLDRAVTPPPSRAGWPRSASAPTTAARYACPPASAAIFGLRPCRRPHPAHPGCSSPALGPTHARSDELQSGRSPARSTNSGPRSSRLPAPIRATRLSLPVAPPPAARCSTQISRRRCSALPARRAPITEPEIEHELDLVCAALAEGRVPRSSKDESPNSRRAHRSSGPS